MEKRVWNFTDPAHREQLRSLSQSYPAGSWQDRLGGICFTNGCFDLLHAGHVDLLKRLRWHGAQVFVGLNSDSSVCRLKGPMRPIFDQDRRAALILATGYVDHVVIFDEETPEALMSTLKPAYYVRFSPLDSEMARRASEHVKIVEYKREIDISTTDIIEHVIGSLFESSRRAR